MTYLMSSFAIARVSQEMQVLVGGFLDKAYQPDFNSVLLRFNAPSDKEGKNYERKDLLVQVGQYMAMGRFDIEVPKTPSNFAQTLRKHLDNARVTKVYQYRFDRIIVLELEHKEGELRLIFEMFSEGNVILVMGETILLPLHSKSWKYREVKSRSLFQFPPSKADPQEMGPEELARVMDSTTSDLVRALVNDVNIPPKNAEDLCMRMGLDKNSMPGQLDGQAKMRLYEGLRERLEQLRSQRGGYLYFEEVDGARQYLDVQPMEMLTYEGKGVQAYPALSDAVVEYVRAAKAEKDAGPVHDPEVERVARQIQEQESSITAFLKESEEAKIKGDAIYSEFGRCQEVLEKINRLKTQLGWDKAAEQLKDDPAIKSLNIKAGYVIVPLPHEGGQLDVKLELDMDVNGNAGALYERSKKVKEKSKGAQIALEAAKKRLIVAKSSAEASRPKPKAAKTKLFWFDAYRWFISTEGNMVVAGRDAGSNDKVVKKYLQTGDRYAHADIHGAPSVVVKKEAGDITGPTMNEACEFAVIYSRAWNAKVGSGSAYWVNPEQVSKTPEAGEFLARGAFVIRGKRNFVTDIPIICAVGEVEYQGERKIMGGPVSAVKMRSKRYYVLVPGKVKISDVANEMAHEFGVIVDEVSKALPPGDIEIKERIGVK